MSIESIVGTTIAAGGAGVLGAVVNAIVNRRKASAEVTEQISRAAGSLVERLEQENARLQKDRAVDHRLMRDLEARLDAQWKEANDRDRWFLAYQRDLAKTFERLQVTLESHVRFDQDLIARLAAHGETDLPDPPPLTVPGVPTPPDGLGAVPNKRSD